MAAVQQLEEDPGQFENEAPSDMFHSYQIGEDDDHDEIVPGGCYYTVESDFPSPPYDSDGEMIGPLSMRSAAQPDDENEIVLGDDNYEGLNIDLNRFSNFIDNDEPMTLNIGVPLFQTAESADIVYEEPLKPAKLVGKYLIGADLGEGSYGKVKDALDTETLVRRAVKILRQKKLRKIPGGEVNVLREIALHRELVHPNIVRLADILRVSSSSSPHGAEKVLANVASSPANLLDPCITRGIEGLGGAGGSAGFFKIGTSSLGTMSNSDEKLYVVMEYCTISLQQVIEAAPSKRLPEWQTHRYFQQLLEGLQYLHSKGIIHKDIKPGNLLLGNDGNVKICDFGVAEKLSPFAPNDLIAGSQGSPICQPPEVANGESPFHGFKLDVWSSGVTLYVMLTGTYPFEGENIYQVFQAVAKGQYEIPTNIDSGLQQLIQGMLASNAEERLSLDEVAIHDWVRRRHPSTGPDVSLAMWNRPSTVLTALEKHGCPPIDLFLPSMAPGTSLSVPQSPHVGSPNSLNAHSSLPQEQIPPAHAEDNVPQSLENTAPTSPLTSPNRNGGATSPVLLPPSSPPPMSPARRSTRKSSRRTGAGQNGGGRKIKCSLS